MARIKGTALIRMVQVLRHNREAARALLPKELHGPYLDERLLPSSWYPEEHYKVLLLALGRMIRPMIDGDVWEFIGVEGAKKDFAGIYSSAIRPGDPQGSLERVDRIWPLYRDTGRLEVEMQGVGAARIFLHDYPLACPEICGTMTGYLREFLTIAGAQDVTARLVDVPPSSEGPAEWSIAFKVP